MSTEVKQKMRLEISFKQTTKDTALWLAIQELEEKSFTIKEILYKALIQEVKKEWRYV